MLISKESAYTRSVLVLAVKMGVPVLVGEGRLYSGNQLKFPFGFRSTEPKRYTVLTKNCYKTDKHL